MYEYLSGMLTKVNPKYVVLDNNGIGYLIYVANPYYFELNKEYITLGQLLKIADIVSSGGEAKIALQELEITVNGEFENRRGKKLYSGDVIVIDGNKIELV